MAGRIKVVRSSNGSTNRGPRVWRRTPCGGAWKRAATPSAGPKFCPCGGIPCWKRWKQWSIEDHYAQIQVPVLSFAAWYDIFLGGSLKNFVRLKTEAGTEAARRGQRLAVTVGGHAGQSSTGKVGAVELGTKLPVDSDEVTLRWYDWLLKDEANGVEKEKPVKIFVMGKNEWRDEDDWPLARAKNTRYFLHSAGAANGL